MDSGFGTIFGGFIYKFEFKIGNLTIFMKLLFFVFLFNFVHHGDLPVFMAFEPGSVDVFFA